MTDNQTVIQQPPTQPPSDDSWSRALTVGTICFFTGFGLAVIFLSEPEFRVTGFIIIIVFGFIIRGARYAFASSEYDQAVMRQAARKDELQLLKERSAVQQREIKLHQAAERAARHTVQVQKTYVFTSDDFDDAAIGLLLPPIKAAKKANAKVTGQGLIETFLRGLR